MIEITDLLVRFGNVKPIDNLSAILSHPVCGLIGPNGAGKTTLLNVLSGFVAPVAGNIRLDGVSLLESSPLQRVHQGLRRSFQTEQVVEDLTVFDNLAALADNVLPASQRRASVERALEFSGLSACSEHLGGNLNLFQRRLVELGKCLVGEPTLILLDEPAAGLTEEESTRLRDLILQIPAAFSAQVLVIDHDVELIRALCSEILVLDYGKRLALGATDTVLAEPDVRRAWLGEV